MPAVADLLHTSFRRFGPRLPCVTARLGERLAAEFPELAPMTTATPCDPVWDDATQFLSVVVRAADEPKRLNRYLAGLARDPRLKSVTADHLTPARELLLELLGEAAGDEWDAEMESVWTETLELVELRLCDHLPRSREACRPRDGQEAAS